MIGFGVIEVDMTSGVWFVGDGSSRSEKWTQCLSMSVPTHFPVTFDTVLAGLVLSPHGRVGRRNPAST
mgnify:CR=1 FL=1